MLCRSIWRREDGKCWTQRERITTRQIHSLFLCLQIRLYEKQYSYTVRLLTDPVAVCEYKVITVTKTSSHKCHSLLGFQLIHILHAKADRLTPWKALATTGQLTTTRNYESNAQAYRSCSSWHSRATCCLSQRSWSDRVGTGIPGISGTGDMAASSIFGRIK